MIEHPDRLATRRVRSGDDIQAIFSAEVTVKRRPNRLRLAAETVRALRPVELDQIRGQAAAPAIQSDYTECIKSCSQQV
jgi:hypothetical protein